ncbi:MAG TPA: H-NS histone family protein [Aquabacterium sp.]|nr:H-NS histone family protein [Aquabacterium sp.]HEX5373134.1 H-NS histone family protein [Aquabacterium sp.]
MKTPEQEAVLRSIRKLIEFWRITPEELEIDPSEPPVVMHEPVLAPKYCHPVSGDTWDGQGPQPQWLKEALTKQGYTVEELRCKDPEESDQTH